MTPEEANKQRQDLQAAMADAQSKSAHSDAFHKSGYDAAAQEMQRRMDLLNQSNPPDTGYKPFDYGGRGDLADSEANYYRHMGQGFGNRQAPTTDYSLADQSRGQESNALGLQQAAAMGQMPSVAAIQQQQGLNQAMGMNSSMAASARGGGNSQALAARSALAGNADMQQQAVNSAAALRAQEMADARGAYMGGAMGMGNQDIGRAQYGSTLAQNQMFGNDKAQLAAEGLRGNVFHEVNVGNNAEQDRLAQNTGQNSQLSAGVARDNAKLQAEEDARHDQRTAQGIGAAGTAIKPAFDEGGLFGKKAPPMGYGRDPRQSPNDKIGPGY